jgi:hypothetical protein
MVIAKRLRSRMREDASLLAWEEEIHRVIPTILSTTKLGTIIFSTIKLGTIILNGGAVLKVKEILTIVAGTTVEHVITLIEHALSEELGIGEEVKGFQSGVIADLGGLTREFSGDRGGWDGLGGRGELSDLSDWGGLNDLGGCGKSSCLLLCHAALLLRGLARLVLVVGVLAHVLGLCLICQSVPVVTNLLWFRVPTGRNQAGCNLSACSSEIKNWKTHRSHCY